MNSLLQAFVEGLLNPWMTPAHVLTLVALGLFAGQQGGRGVTLVVFAGALAVALGALALAVGETSARMVLLSDAALLGILVAAAYALPRPIGWMLAAIAGAALALDSPPQAITIAEGKATLVGTAAGACTMLFAVTTVASYAALEWQRLAVRILASWIAASAILVLAVMLR